MGVHYVREPGSHDSSERRTTSPVEAASMWVTGARFEGRGECFLRVSYVQKNKAAVKWLFLASAPPQDIEARTCRRTSDDYATNACVDPFEPPSSDEALRRLQTSLYGVYREK